MEETHQAAQLMNVDSQADPLTSQPVPKRGQREAEVDAELLHRAGEGDGRAFHQLVDLHADRLYRLAVSLVGNAVDAEDVLQEALAGAYRSAAKFEGRSSVKSWLTRILVTQAAKFWRSRRGKRDSVLDEESSPATDSAGIPAVDARLDLQQALRKLSREHRQVLVLRELDGMGYEEIAQVLNVPRGTIESRLFRARAELKKNLKSYQP